MENNNLFFNLPIEIQMKIVKMNPHPLVEIFKHGFVDEIKHYNTYNRDSKQWEWYDNHKHSKMWSKPIDIYLGYHCFNSEEKYNESADESDDESDNESYDESVDESDDDSDDD